MRVIAGICKGHRLKPVPGMNTRPTTDKVRESIFNMIGPFFDGGSSLDLYGGSGALSIEGLSRGIEKAIIIDLEPKAVGIIKDNLETCNFSEQAEVYRNDAKRALKVLHKRDLRFDIIYLDPPYKKQAIVAIMEQIEKFDLLHHEGIIVVEHTTEISLPDQINKFIKVRYETYGVSGVSIYKFGGEVHE
jgi:16S rRNA (guanine966-N2)-methyltransferase